jgi:hypothetical protein
VSRYPAGLERSASRLHAGQGTHAVAAGKSPSVSQTGYRRWQVGAGHRGPGESYVEHGEGSKAFLASLAEVA